jgi:zinc protease
LLVVGSTLPLQKVESALKEILRQTYRLRREDFTGEELARAKRMVESDAIFQRETVQGQARKLGFFETVAGHVDEEERYLKDIVRATPEDLRRAADRYLRTENLSLSLLRPNGDHAMKEADLLAIAEEAEREVSPQVKSRPAVNYTRLSTRSDVAGPRDPGGILVEQLPNGVKLVVKEDRTVPVVSFRAAWPGGLRWESAENNGLNNLLARMLLRGTEKRSSRELARAIDDLAGSVGGTAGRNSYGARGEFLSADLNTGFDLFSEVMLRPAFDQGEFERERAIVLEDLRSKDDSPASVAFSLFNQALYDRHPYRMEYQGSLASVEAQTTDGLRRYMTEHYPVAGMTLAIVGDVKPEKARELALSLPGSTSITPPPKVELDGPLENSRDARKHLDRRQAHLVIGFRGTTLASPDRAPLDVLCAILSGQGGRLFLELRDKRSMAYSVSAFSSEGIDPGSVGVYIGTSPDKLAEAQAALIEQIQLVRSEFVLPEEIDRARRHLTGGHEIGLQRLSSRAGVMALDEAYGLGADRHLHYAERIRAVSADDVLRVARHYLDLDRVVTALVSPTV